MHWRYQSGRYCSSGTSRTYYRLWWPRSSRALGCSGTLSRLSDSSDVVPHGVAIGQMRGCSQLSTEGTFSNSTVVVLTKRATGCHLTFCSSPAFAEATVYQSEAQVDNGYVGKIEFDLAHWQQVAAERYPTACPNPIPTTPPVAVPRPAATDPLQVAVARLLGYRGRPRPMPAWNSPMKPASGHTPTSRRPRRRRRHSLPARAR